MMSRKNQSEEEYDHSRYRINVDAGLNIYRLRKVAIGNMGILSVGFSKPAKYFRFYHEATLYSDQRGLKP
jgi:hypothetical protein